MIRSILHKATKNDNTPAVDLSSEVGFFANNTICRMSVGKKCTKADLGGKEFKEVLEDVLPLTGDFQYSDCIPLLRWLDSQSNRRRQAELTEIFFVFLGRFVVEHIERRKNYSALQCEDFVDLLLSLSRGESMEIKITREHIKKIAFDLISATTDTSGGTLEWAMSELLRNPWSMRKAQSHDRRTPSTSSSVSTINKNTQVLVNAWAIARDPTVWEEANEFKPASFLGSKIDVKGQDFVLIPFGSGRRGCPGTNLGMSLVQLGLAQLLHCFNWSLPQGITPENLDMSEVYGVTMPRAGHLLAIPTLRLLLELYEPKP
ncbi:hypothetical protein SUGI_0216360 [Cryptomeria japonica]|nr:hypothetical protein SUGI_0216360 [Cryptomeria japonica]